MDKERVPKDAINKYYFMFFVDAKKTVSDFEFAF